MFMYLLFSVLIIASPLSFGMEGQSKTLFELVKQEEINIAAVKALLENNDKLVNQKDERGFAPLHYACRGKGTAIVDALLKAGADVESLNRWNNTPLCEAAANGDAEVVRVLILEGRADVNFASGKPLQLANLRKSGDHYAIKDLLKQLTKKEFGGLLPNN